MSIQMPEGVLRDVVAKAILDGISQEARAGIIQEAIVKLVETPPKPSAYGAQPPSPLKEAFDRAVQAEMSRVVRDMVAGDAAVQAAIRMIVSPMIDDLSKGNWDGLPEALGTAFGAWFRDREPS